MCQRRCFGAQAVALEQAGIDRNEQREIRKRTAVRQKQFLHDGSRRRWESRRQTACWTRGLTTFSEDRASGRRYVSTLGRRFVYRMSSILFYINSKKCTQSRFDMSSKKRTTMWPESRFCTSMSRPAQWLGITRFEPLYLVRHSRKVAHRRAVCSKSEDTIWSVNCVQCKRIVCVAARLCNRCTQPRTLPLS